MARSHRGGAKKIDYVEWSGLLGTGQVLTVNATVVSEVVNSTVAATFLRVRGEIVASIDGPTDGDKSATAVGIIVVTEE